MNQLGPLLPLLLIAAAFYFLILRPAQNRQRAAQQVVSQLGPGARVMTSAGMLGTVRSIEGDQIDLEIAPGVTVRCMAASVAKILEPSPQKAAELGTSEEPRPSIIEGDTPGS